MTACFVILLLFSERALQNKDLKLCRLTILLTVEVGKTFPIARAIFAANKSARYGMEVTNSHQERCNTLSINFYIKEGSAAKWVLDVDSAEVRQV